MVLKKAIVGQAEAEMRKKCSYRKWKAHWTQSSGCNALNRSYGGLAPVHIALHNSKSVHCRAQRSLIPHMVME